MVFRHGQVLVLVRALSFQRDMVVEHELLLRRRKNENYIFVSFIYAANISNPTSHFSREKIKIQLKR